MAIIKVTLLLKLLQTNFMFLFDFNIHTVHYLKLSISPLTISMVQTTLLQLQLHTIDFIYYVGGHGALNLFDMIPIFLYMIFAGQQCKPEFIPHLRPVHFL